MLKWEPDKPIRWWQWRRRRHCPHIHVRGIYGDAIIHSGWFRLVCLDCGVYLNGPVSIAEHRHNIIIGEETDE